MTTPGHSARAFVDRPVTDIAAAQIAALEAADHWGLSEPIVLRAGMNVISTCHDVVLRVGRPSVDAMLALELARCWRDAGLAVPQPVRDDVVVVGDLSVTCWERVESTGEPVDWRSVGAMIRRVHETPASSLPARLPLPSPAAFPWWDFDTLVDEVGDHIDPAALEGLVAAIDRHRGWASAHGSVVCHGDVHPGNVIMSADGPVLLDWDLLCWAPPGWDHAPMMTLASRWGGQPGEYEEFAAGYGRSFVGEPAADAFAELRLVAATLMRLVAARTNPVAAPEAQLRLAYWRGDPDAPGWTAQ